MRGLWTHLERLGRGGIGTRGPGESQIETDRRLARDRISTLRRRLVRVERNRGSCARAASGSALPDGRARRLHERRQVDPAERDDRRRGRGGGEALPHARSDHPRLRHDGRRYLLTDTVGFIRKLPHQLVEAFKATLEETALADLIVHVVDASEPEERAPGGDRRRRLGARGDRRRRGAPPARLQQGGPPGRRPRRTSSRSATRDRWRSPRSPGRAWRSFATASSRPSRRRSRAGAAVPVLGGRRAGRAPRGRRRPRSRGSPGRRPRSRARPCRARAPIYGLCAERLASSDGRRRPV